MKPFFFYPFVAKHLAESAWCLRWRPMLEECGVLPGRFTVAGLALSTAGHDAFGKCLRTKDVVCSCHCVCCLSCCTTHSSFQEAVKMITKDTAVVYLLVLGYLSPIPLGFPASSFLSGAYCCNIRASCCEGWWGWALPVACCSTQPASLGKASCCSWGWFLCCPLSHLISPWRHRSPAELTRGS